MAIKCTILRVVICPFEHKLISYRYATVPKQTPLSFNLLELAQGGYSGTPPGASRCSGTPELIGLNRIFSFYSRLNSRILYYQSRINRIRSNETRINRRILPIQSLINRRILSPFSPINRILSFQSPIIVSRCPENRDFVPNSGKLLKQPDFCPEKSGIYNIP